ncbi:MAG: cytochrome c biogenesis protein CcsA, partial [bacterium]|nr:cytochrome c biogenesis protein CcsA [bacterium]
RHLLTMSSGLAWDEVYADPDSHVNRYSRHLAEGTPDGVITLLRGLRRAAPPGTRWHYNTGDTYLLGRVLTRAITPERERSMIRMVYGVACFALLLSFVGTVLGGIWADQSWGRFWGWDPKENGAALVVLINAIILHARWGGMIRAKGVAVLAVAGNIVSAWSWFGTNMLGVGLHAYGFMDSASMWLMIFVLSQVALMLSAMIPGARPALKPI